MGGDGGGGGIFAAARGVEASGMPEVLVEFPEPVTSEHGVSYFAKACGSPTRDGLWQGWIEFTPVDGGPTIRSSRETTQPNRHDAVYWATGLTPVYLEGSLGRALNPLVRPAPVPPAPPAYDGPAPNVIEGPPPVDSVLNPFSVYRKGEALLRRQLAALSGWHLVNIIRAHGLSDRSDTELQAMTPAQLVEVIVANVKKLRTVSAE